MAGLEFRVLGQLEVARDGEPIAVTAPKQRALLSLLLLRHDEPVLQAELIEALWEGNLPRTARAAFQNLIHALRRLLGPETLERMPGGYVVHARPGSLDVELFRRLTAQARGATAPERVAKLSQALALWRGPAFSELAGDPSAEAEIARLEDERLGALEERIEAQLELGEHAALVPELEELVARHAVRERLWAQLMLALYRAGRQADALAAYRRAHETFVDALGIEPGVVLREVQRAILVQDAALADPKQALGSTLERAAAIIPREPRERVQSLFEYGSALIRLGELGQAASTLQAAGRSAATVGDRGVEERVRLLLSYLAVFADGASIAEHLAVAERVAVAFQDLGDDAGLALALSHRAHVLRDTGYADLALGLARQGIELANAAGDRACEATCRRMTASCAAMGSTPVDDAIALCEEVDATAGEAGPLFVWDLLAWLVAQSGRIDEARALYERQLEALRDAGIVLQLMVGLSRAAHAERAAGDLAPAAAHLRTAYALTRADNVRGDLSVVAAELACVLALDGEQLEARRLADESRSLTAPGDVLAELLWHRAQALVAARDGRHDDARRLSDEACTRAAATDWLTFQGETLEEAACVRRLSGDAEGESRALGEALTVYRQKGNVAGAGRTAQALAAQP